LLLFAMILFVDCIEEQVMDTVAASLTD